MLSACEFGVPQLRPRFILVALRPDAYAQFEWPQAMKTPPTVGETLRDLMAANGWPGADAWARRPAASARRWSAAPASTAAPTWARPGPARPG